MGDDAWFIWLIIAVAVIMVVAIAFGEDTKPLPGACPKGTVVVRETAKERECRPVQRLHIDPGGQH